MMRRTVLATASILLLSLPCGAATKSPGLTDARPLAAVPAVDLPRSLETRPVTHATTEASQKRLRMRQVLLLWLLASQPAKPVAP